jgi:hypothetical protein
MEIERRTHSERAHIDKAKEDEQSEGAHEVVEDADAARFEHERLALG